VAQHAVTSEPDGLRAHLRCSLPNYMLPSAFVLLEQLPLTPNGKVNRAALPAPDGGTSAGEYVAPQTAAEQKLAAIWVELLRCERVGINDNFFDIGGNSLLLVRLHRRIEAAFNCDIALMLLFQHPTIRTFVSFLGGISLRENAVEVGRDRGQRRRELLTRRGAEQRVVTAGP
jgi:hypothetical protein